MDLSIFDIAGSAMRAQSTRLNTTASNLANASSVAASAEEAYRSRHPVFAAALERAIGGAGDRAGIGGVEMRGIVESRRPPERRHAPDHPLADADGYVYGSNVDVIEEMTNMMSASRNYQSNVELLNTARQLALQTLKLAE